MPHESGTYDYMEKNGKRYRRPKGQTTTDWKEMPEGEHGTESRMEAKYDKKKTRESAADILKKRQKAGAAPIPTPTAEDQAVNLKKKKKSPFGGLAKKKGY